MKQNFWHKIKTLWELIIILENIFIILILLASLYSLTLSKGIDNFYFVISFQKLKEEPWFLIILSFLSFFIFFLRVKVLQCSLNRFEENVNFKEALRLLLQIDIRRAFSPIGIISSISFFNKEKNPIKGIKPFIYNQFIFALGNWLFYLLILLFLWKNIFILLFLLSLLIIVIYFLQPKDFIGLFFAITEEAPRLILFILIFYLFNINANFNQIVYIYIAWDFSSAITPVLFGAGISELIATIVSFFVGVPFQLTLLPLFVARIFIVYLPLTLFFYKPS
jgi:MFS family permease